MGNFGNTGKRGHVYKPAVDEEAVPCPDGYMSTDCVQPSVKVNLAAMDVDPDGSLTDVINCMMKRIREMEREMSLLRRDLNRINN